LSAECFGLLEWRKMLMLGRRRVESIVFVNKPTLDFTTVQ